MKTFNTDVFWKLPKRAQMNKNFQGGQRFTVGGISDPMASLMPSARAKQTTGAVEGCMSRAAKS